jgi:hypothetical protein
MKVALMTVISLVVGYIIADVITLLHPLRDLGLLESLALWPRRHSPSLRMPFKGDDWVRAWIRGQILDKARDGLSRMTRMEGDQGRLQQGLSKIFDDLSRSFERAAQQLLRDAEFEARKTDEDLDR